LCLGVVARVYHLLAKEATCAPNFHHIDDFRKAREDENAIGTSIPEPISA
jgi:hypothetical protein